MVLVIPIWMMQPGALVSAMVIELLLGMVAMDAASNPGRGYLALSSIILFIAGFFIEGPVGIGLLAQFIPVQLICVFADWGEGKDGKK